MESYDPTKTFVHLGTGPEVTVMSVDAGFWDSISERTDLGSGRLVTGSIVTEDWRSWEMHPAGDELIVVMEGSIRIHLEHGSERAHHAVSAPDFVVMPAGTWHTVDVLEPARLLTATWGAGTQHRSR